MLTKNTLNIRRAQRWWGPSYQGHELPPQIMAPLAYIMMGLVLIAFLVAGGLWLAIGLFIFPAADSK